MQSVQFFVWCLVPSIIGVSGNIGCEGSNFTINCPTTDFGIEFSKASFTREPTSQTEPNCEYCCDYSNPNNAVGSFDDMNDDAYKGTGIYVPCNNILNLTEILTTHCAMQMETTKSFGCQIEVSLTSFGNILGIVGDMDPCQSVFKYLDFEFTCVKRQYSLPHG